MRERPKPYLKTKISPEDAGLLSLGPVRSHPKHPSNHIATRQKYRGRKSFYCSAVGVDG